MRKPCPRCKSLDTRVITPRMMSCRNCRNTWGLYSGASSSGKKITYNRGKGMVSQKKSKKIHSA